MTIKLTIHPGKYVVNTPHSHVQRQPLTFTRLDRALAHVEALARGES